MVMVTFKSKFILYSGRLEVKFSKELEKKNEFITAGAFNKDSSVVLVGTNHGYIHSFKISDGAIDQIPYLAASDEQAISQLVTLNNIEENDTYLMVCGGKILTIYTHNKRTTEEVEFGEDGEVYAGHNICNV